MEDQKRRDTCYDIQQNELLRNVEKMKEMVGEQRKTIAHLTKQIETAKTEMNSAMRILWSAALSVGGVIEISDFDMARADYTSELITEYDLAKRATIIKAIVCTPN